MTDITLACFGLVGTLVADAGVVERAYSEAIATQGVVSGTSAFARSMAHVHRALGQTPADVLAGLFPGNQPRAQAALLTFERALAGGVTRSHPTAIPGATEVLTAMTESGCRICVMTNLPRREMTAMLQALRWHDLINVTLTADDVPRGCPSPDLALAAMLRVGVGDVRELAMIQPTAAGVECGRRAGARVVAGVLTGAHPEARLRAAGATHVIESVADLPALLAAVAGGPAPATDHRVPGQVPGSASIAVPPQVGVERGALGL